MSAMHPPIPPNCPFFSMKSGKYFFCMGCMGEDFDLELESYYSDVTPVIAAVAEVAWLEEADRIASEIQRNKNLGHGGGRTPLTDNETQYPAYAICVAHSLAWRAWGKGEWKP